jgi:hypothetical protein
MDKSNALPKGAPIEIRAVANGFIVIPTSIISANRSMAGDEMMVFTRLGYAEDLYDSLLGFIKDHFDKEG